MRSLRTFIAAALVGCIHLASTDETGPSYKACYDSPGSLKQKDTIDFNSMGSCRIVCVDQDKSKGGIGFSVMGLTAGTKCYCGQSLPNPAHRVDDSKCGFSCPGYPQNKCGSRDGSYIAVYITGLEKNPEVDQNPSTTSSSSSSTDTSTTSMVVVTPTSSTQQENSGGSVNKGAVAAGVVVGVLLVLSMGAGGFLYIRNRNRQQVEEEYRRSAAAREFAQKPSSDHRLDPGMVQKRDSVGSIADNEDYSRRILKVTNPDG